MAELMVPFWFAVMTPPPTRFNCPPGHRVAGAVEGDACGVERGIMVIVDSGRAGGEKSATDESTQSPMSPRFPAVSVAQKLSVSQTPSPGVKDPGEEGVVVQYKMSACAAGANRRKVNPKAVRATPIANFPLLLIKALSTCKMAERN